MNRLFAAILLLPCLALPAAAETSLWVVKAEKSTTYLGGTIHLLRPADFPLPPEFDAAYAAAKTVVFEADPGRLTSPEILQKIASGAVYPPGMSLEKALKPETYELLRSYCRESGIPVEALAPLKPGMVFLTLLSVELQKLGVTEQGVDYAYFERAVTDGKAVGELETAEQQVEFILALGEEDPDRFIRQSLDDIEKSRGQFEPLLKAWRAGDGATLERELLADTRRDYPELYRTLFLQRNAAWLPQLEAYIRTPETELVLVGVAHLVGADGLLETLRRRGYAVEQVR
jgi:uncharacterized protein YbaP (TraB family)